MKFEDCIDANFENKISLFEWFINQEHIPFDMSSDAHGMYYTMYMDFLKEIEKKHYITGDEYFWFSTAGKLLSTKHTIILGGVHSISSNYIRINKQKLRELKIEQILK